MRRAVGIALKNDRRHLDHRAHSETMFQVVVLRLAFGQSKPPAIIMDYDVDVIGIVKGGSAAIERDVIKIPFRRSELPNDFRKIVPVFFITGPAAFRRQIIFVPPFEFGPWRQRYLAGFLVADQIPTY